MRYSLIFSFLIAISLSGCSGVKVVTDSEKATDFSKYKTFSFLGWQYNSDELLNDIEKERLRAAFSTEFEKRNLKFVEQGGDLSITLFLVLKKETYTTAYTNYYARAGAGRGGYRGIGGTDAASTTYYDEELLRGHLIMDVFDESTSGKIWQGIASGLINEKPEKRAKEIPKSVAALMKKFPVDASND